MQEVLLARVEAFLAEFPFLNRYVKARQFSERPKVQRIDLDLLQRVCWTGRWGWSQRHDIYDVRFLFIGEDGQELGEVRQCDVEQPKFNLFRISTWVKQCIDGEYVLEALQRLDDPNQVVYILELQDMFWLRREEYDPGCGLKATIHKVPWGRKFSQWIMEIRAIAAEELRSEVVQINTV